TFNIVPEKREIVNEIDFEALEIIDEPKSLKNRPPVVTIMGHVDHGKTSLLDYIRNTRVAEGEIGGITQKIGAYQVDYHGEKITFIDTPGHAAFTAMRARGSYMTDIVVIVIAADDGMRPQTKEAIDHAKAAKVPFIVAVNKIDKPGVEVEKIKAELSAYDVLVEEWGGSIVFQEISAKTGKGVPELLDAILTTAMMLELKANPLRKAIGTVIEAKLDKGLGPIATVLVQNGSLRVGDSLVVGSCFCRVRLIKDDLNRLVKVAGPSTPVEITGFTDVPDAGDKFMGYDDEKKARFVAEKRKARKITQLRKGTPGVSLQDLHERILAGEMQTINVIIKSDNQGSSEAVKGALEKIEVEGVKIDVIRFQAGAITESDISLASASNAIIFGFNIVPDSIIKRKAQEEGVDIRVYRIIYDLVEDVKKAMKGLLKPTFEESVQGEVEIRQIITISKFVIAGCYVRDGVVKNDSKVRLIRDGVPIYESTISSLKRLKNDAKEVKTGLECGITIENFSDYKVGDLIQTFEMKEIKGI
ncbi:MAG: translation initiation factor IF-2, partial [Bacillales bacterium]|nr:translation initiation factor IF-2 [Bacillales bacterium]